MGRIGQRMIPEALDGGSDCYSRVGYRMTLIRSGELSRSYIARSPDG
jgi:hypothetical protein